MDKKISVMLVDDYYIVREDLKTLVDWEGLGFRICCEAINGKQGLELFQKYRPQLVITDIKMPVMNGLEMAQEILSMYPKVCVILLTAYDEFDLAWNALGMGITHYLLKHEIGEANLTELLVKIRTQLSKAQESRRKSIEEQIRGSLMGTLPSKSGEDGGEEFLDMEKSIFSFVLFRGRNGLSGDTLRELASRQGDSVSAALLMESHGVFTFLFESKLPSELAYYSGVSNFISQIKAGLGEDVDVAVSKRLRERKAIREIYRRALDSLEISVFHKEAGQIIWCEVAPPCREIDHAELYQFMAQIKTLLSERNYGQAYLVVEDYVLKKCIPEKRIDQFRLQKTFLIGLLEEHNGRHHFLEQAQVDTLKSPEDTAYGFLEKLKRFTEQMAQADGRNLSRNVRKAVAYIMENYQDAITLEDVAEEIGVSAMYAGKFFKKEMGVSFKRYLSEARVEKAKELLRSGNYRIYEVSRMTGYQTTQYFCNVFKKVTGISPGEFMEYEDKEQEK